MPDIDEENRIIGHKNGIALNEFARSIFPHPSDTLKFMHLETETRCLIARLITNER
jgi:hypothetical protein